MDIMKMAGDFLPAGALESVAGSSGVDKDMVGNILQHAGPSLAGALGSKVQGDSSFLDKALGAVSGGNALEMVLGSQAQSIAASIASKFGISSSIVTMVLEKVMPYLLEAVKGGKISPEMLKAAAGLADGVDMSDIQNIAGAVLGGGSKKAGGMLGSLGGLLGGMLGKR